MFDGEEQVATDLPNTTLTGDTARPFLRDNWPVVCVTAAFGTFLSCLFFVLLFLFITGNNASTAQFHDPRRDNLGHEAVIPIHYDVHLQTYPEMFKGRVTIQLVPQEDTDAILLHSRGLSIFNVEVASYEQEALKPTLAYNHTLHSVTLHLVRDLKRSRTYNVSMDFEGVFQLEPKGLYLDVTGDYHTVVSFMEPQNARLVFPCIDLPSLRSTFDVSIIKHNSSYTALANSKLRAEVTRTDGTVLSLFKRTLPIPTHLVALIITNLPMRSGDQLSVWIRPAFEDEFEHVFRYVETCIEKATQFVGYKFPFRHLNVISLHEYPRESHMSWGLLALRTDTFLQARGYPAVETAFLRLTQAVLGAWFGGTVSPRSWKMSWFNDGLSLLYAVKVLGSLRPEWPLHSTLGICLHGYMALYNSTAVLQQDPPALLEWECTAELQRRACMAAIRIAMIRRIMGPSSFRQAVATFLRKFNYRPATDDDFWSALIPTGPRIRGKHILCTWTTQPGYPCIVANRLGANTIRFQQEPFCGPSCPPFDNRSWAIPLTATHANKHPSQDDLTVWLTDRTIDAYIPNATSDDWILINVGHEGLYRVEYQDSNWDMLTNQLKSDRHVIPVSNRAQILDDLFYLAFAGYRSLEKFYAVLPYLEQEQDVLPWTVYTYTVEAFEAKRGTLPEEWKELDRRLCANTIFRFNGSDEGDNSSPRAAFEAHMVKHCCARGALCSVPALFQHLPKLTALGYPQL